MTLDEATRHLAEAGIDNPRAEARLLLAHVMGITRDTTLTVTPTPEQAQSLADLVARRSASSIKVSLSGRGTSTPGPTSKSRLQNSLWPVI